MFKSEKDIRFYMDEASHTGITNGIRSSFLFWLITSVVSFWIFDWGISWGQVATFIPGFFFGYWVCCSWFKGHAGSIEHRP